MGKKHQKLSSPFISFEAVQAETNSIAPSYIYLWYNSPLPCNMNSLATEPQSWDTKRTGLKPCIFRNASTIFSRPDVRILTGTSKVSCVSSSIWILMETSFPGGVIGGFCPCSKVLIPAFSWAPNRDPAVGLCSVSPMFRETRFLYLKRESRQRRLLPLISKSCKYIYHSAHVQQVVNYHMILNTNTIMNIYISYLYHMKAGKWGKLYNF